MSKPAVRRSACDLCRAKRIRCLRAENSTAPCARCSHIGARCVTGAPGHPGRPPKRLVNSGSKPRDPAVSSANISSPGPGHRTSTVRDMDLVHVHAPLMAGEPTPASAATRASPCRTDSDTSWDQLGGVAVSNLAVSKTAVAPYSPGQLCTHRIQPDFWGVPGDKSAFFGPSSIERSPALDMDLDLFLHPWETVLPPSPLPQSSSPASSLMRFREQMDQRIAAVDAYFSDPLKVVQGCKAETADLEAEHPAALLLTCCKEFVDIIEGLKLSGQTHMHSDCTLSTEIVLLALSNYIALMKLFDSLFYTMYKFICQLPPDSFKSLKVKSVLRIGGIASLQDMPIKTYAMGIVDVIKGQVRNLERCMGIPVEYCLSSEVGGSTTAAAAGIFAGTDRSQLFEAVMAQEDVQSQRGSKSYVESIRASIQDSMRFLDD